MRCSGTNSKGQPCAWDGPLYADGRCYWHTEYIADDQRRSRARKAVEARHAPKAGVDLEALRQQYGSRPQAFLSEVLGVRSLWSGQRRMLQAIASSDRVSVVGANSIGKTFLLAAAAAWKLYCDPVPPMIVVLSPIARQQRGQFWRELHSLLDDTALPGERFKTIDRGIEISGSHRIFGFSTSTSAGTPEGRALGYHAENLIVIVDQAESIEEWEWHAILKSKPRQVIACGNSTEPVGHWYGLHSQSPSNGWASITLSALDLINDPAHLLMPGAADAGWIAEVERTFGRDSAFFRVAVLGEFAHGYAENILIPADLWQRADALWHEERDRLEVEARRYRPVVGWDVAAQSGTNAAAAIRGPLFIGIECWKEPDLDLSITTLREKLRGWGLKKEWNEGGDRGGVYIGPGWRQGFVLVVDATGAGWGAASRLRARGWQAVPFKASAAPDSRVDGTFHAFANARVEAYWALRDLLQRGQLAIPWSDDLVEQGSVRFSEDLAGRIALEPKKALSQRIGIVSPDQLDALSMACWWQATKRPAAMSA